MPPMFTSTSMGTLLRKALSAARQHAQRQARAAGAGAGGGGRGGSSLNPLERARQAARQIAQQAQEAFPSLSTPSHRLGHALEPIPLRARNAGPAGRGPYARGGSAQSRFYSTTSGSPFQSAYRLPAHARGPRMSSNVGLGSARAYSGGGGAGSAQRLLENVPLGFRALYEGLKDEDFDGARGSSWPAKTRYRPYCPRHDRQRQRKTCRPNRLRRFPSTVSIDSSRASIFSDRAHFFPLRRRRINATPDAGLLIPEALVTPGTTTTLVLPIAATLQAILQPTPHIPYADAELGVAVFSELFHGIGEVAFASDMVLGCVLPVLAKLRSLSVLKELDAQTREDTRVVGSVTRDAFGEPQTIVFDFHDRSEKDVRAILGETLKRNAFGQEWWYIQETVRRQPAAMAVDATIEAWRADSASAAAAGSASTPASPAEVDAQEPVSVIMPSMSLDLDPATLQEMADSWDAHTPGSRHHDDDDSIIATPETGSAGSYLDASSAGSLISDSYFSSSGYNSSSGGSLPSGHDGRLADHFSAQDLRERLALALYSYDGDASSMSDSGSVSAWSSSGPSESDEAVELAVEPSVISLSPSEGMEDVHGGARGRGIEGFDHGLMLVNYW